jgi:signal transduction histidine kinase
VANFSVAARTLVHLGAELITSDEVALNELIKNAFDADSKRVRIDFHIGLDQGELDRLLGTARAHKGTADLNAFVALAAEKVIATGNEADGDAKRATEVVDNIKASKSWPEVAAVLESVNGISVSDHGSGMNKQALQSVFLRIGTSSRLGTQTSQHLKRTILGNKGIGRLAMMRLGDCAVVTSWTAHDSAYRIDFDWRLFDDPEKAIDDIAFDLEKVAAAHEGDSGTVIEVTALRSRWTKKRVEDQFVGGFLRRLQNPFQAAARQALFPIDVHYNSGPRIPIEGMKKLLSEHAQADLELVFDAHDKTTADTVVTTTVVDHERGIDPQLVHRTMEDVAHKVEASPDELRSIGPFTARIRWFNRDTMRMQQTLQGNVKAARLELDLWSGGVAIYRDGFRIGFSGQSTGEDWLALDSSALKRSGFTVNRIQVVGALEISREKNPQLIDRSNREGLVESRQSDLVRQILINFAIEELRRHIQHEGQEDKRAALDLAAKTAPETIRDRIKDAEQGLSEIRARVPADTKKTVQNIADHLHFIKAETKRFEEAVRQVGERREDILELAGVGTVMSGILHELTRTTGNTRQLLQKLARDESPATKELLVKLENEIKAINTRLRQLDPLTPSGRHRKEEFDLAALLQTILRGYEARFERHKIHAELTMSDEDQLKPFMVTMVRGFVSLAVENLVTNSVYWLQRGLKAGAARPEIHLELDPKSKSLSVWDNGPGIASADKERVFTAGFTLRPRGQGLGLFIAAEVATYHQAQLVLDGADGDGRYRTFVLQLPRE